MQILKLHRSSRWLNSDFEALPDEFLFAFIDYIPICKFYPTFPKGYTLILKLYLSDRLLVMLGMVYKACHF